MRVQNIDLDYVASLDINSPEVTKQVNEFKANPKKFLFDPVEIKTIPEQQLRTIAAHYLDFPFRIPMEFNPAVGTGR